MLFTHRYKIFFNKNAISKRSEGLLYSMQGDTKCCLSVCLSSKNAVFDSPGLIVTQMHNINKYYAVPCQLERDDSCGELNVIQIKDGIFAFHNVIRCINALCARIVASQN